MSQTARTKSAVRTPHPRQPRKPSAGARIRAAATITFQPDDEVAAVLLAALGPVRSRPYGVQTRLLNLALRKSLAAAIADYQKIRSIEGFPPLNS